MENIKSNFCVCAGGIVEAGPTQHISEYITERDSVTRALTGTPYMQLLEESLPGSEQGVMYLMQSYDGLHQLPQLFSLGTLNKDHVLDRPCTFLLQMFREIPPMHWRGLEEGHPYSYAYSKGPYACSQTKTPPGERILNKIKGVLLEKIYRVCVSCRTLCAARATRETWGGRDAVNVTFGSRFPGNRKLVVSEVSLSAGAQIKTRYRTVVTQEEFTHIRESISRGDDGAYFLYGDAARDPEEFKKECGLYLLTGGL